MEEKIFVEIRQDENSYSPVTFKFCSVVDAMEFVGTMKEYLSAGMCMTFIFKKGEK